MKTRPTIVTILAALLSCLSAGCAKSTPKNRLDIVLEGPWILYQDLQFDNRGKKIPVLVAIAPNGVSATAVHKHGKDGVAEANSAHSHADDGDQLHHHLPQISAGDGYYIQDAGVYCLAFDGKCAPKGAGFLQSAGYGTTYMLPAKFETDGSTGGSTPRTIWSMIQEDGSIAVILPMPDSYSNEGVWQARLRPRTAPRTTYAMQPNISIGLILHYANGPGKFNLFACSAPASVQNCWGPPNGIDHTNLNNTGTLEVVMKAPDTTDACDFHVRYAYAKAMKVLGPNVNQDMAVIDPALTMDANGNGRYDAPPYVCSGPLKDENREHTDAENEEKQEAVGEVIALTTFYSQIEKILSQIHTTDDNVLTPLVAAAALAKDLDPKYPKISQVQEIGALMREAQRQASRKTESTQVIEDIEAVSENPNTKNGSDCRAPILIVTPNKLPGSDKEQSNAKSSAAPTS
jgi:hypothetical protein